MRLATLASIGVLAVSTAALAQVASTPVEQKVPNSGQTAPDNTAIPASDAMSNDLSGTTAVSPAASVVAPVEKKTTTRRRRR